jgi:hypothetical protein
MDAQQLDDGRGSQIGYRPKALTVDILVELLLGMCVCGEPLSEFPSKERRGAIECDAITQTFRQAHIHFAFWIANQEERRRSTRCSAHALPQQELRNMHDRETTTRLRISGPSVGWI